MLKIRSASLCATLFWLTSCSYLPNPQTMVCEPLVEDWDREKAVLQAKLELCRVDNEILKRKCDD